MADVTDKLIEQIIRLSKEREELSILLTDTTFELGKTRGKLDKLKNNMQKEADKFKKLSIEKKEPAYGFTAVAIEDLIKND
jgi:uncharacterized coiled-coil protein SlyX